MFIFKYTWLYRGEVVGMAEKREVMVIKVIRRRSEKTESKENEKKETAEDSGNEMQFTTLKADNKWDQSNSGDGVLVGGFNVIVALFLLHFWVLRIKVAVETFSYIQKRKKTIMKEYLTLRTETERKTLLPLTVTTVNFSTCKIVDVLLYYFFPFSFFLIIQRNQWEIEK